MLSLYSVIWKQNLREILIFNRKRWTAKELAEHGVVDVVAPADELLEKALWLAACYLSVIHGGAFWGDGDFRSFSSG